MTKREQFLQFVKTGGRPICSPQIGGGAGFDTKVAGKEWISQTTLDDTLAVVGKFDIVPLINIGLYDFGEFNPTIAWKETSRQEDAQKITVGSVLETPCGTLTRTSVEKPHEGGFSTKYPITSSDELKMLDWYLDRAMEMDLSAVTEYVRRHVEKIAGRAALNVQWAVQPYELLCFPNTVDTVFLVQDCPEQFHELMEKIVHLDQLLFGAVAKGGADFVFLGGPGSELISPTYYEKYLIPYSQRVTQSAHEAGLLIYSHICSPIEPFLTMGFYNRMGIDLFETLSPPPMGNVASLEDAFGKLDPAICTRGNLGLDLLLNADPQTIRQKTLDILQAIGNRKHIVAASDYLFYDVPAENIEAMAQTVAEFTA